MSTCWVPWWPFDTKHNDVQHNDTQHNDTQHNDTQHNDIQHNDTQHNDTQHNDTQQNDIQHNDTLLDNLIRRVLHLTGDNLNVVWAKYHSKLECSGRVHDKCIGYIQSLLELKIWSKFCPHG